MIVLDDNIENSNQDLEKLQEYFDINLSGRYVTHIISNEKRYDRYFGTGNPWLIIVHYTSCGTMEAIHKLSNYELHSRVSIHHIVDYKNVFNLVDYRMPAWHAGQSFWKGRREINRYALGIEVVNNGSTPFNDHQIDTLRVLVQYYQHKLEIPDWRVIGHSDISCGRKLDPGLHFPWHRIIKKPELVSLDADGMISQRAISFDVISENHADYLYQVGYNPEYDIKHILDSYRSRYARYI